jgi:putative PIN family toxin of toxin-antitoxin system
MIFAHLDVTPATMLLQRPIAVVFDTNVLLSLFVFADSRFAPLLAAVDAGLWHAYSNAACFAEFRRVLTYQAFALDGTQQEAAASAWQQRLLWPSPAVVNTATLPRCKDRDDQKFLELARDVGADWLITADKALLKLARRDKLRGLFHIITPEAALELL